LVWKKTQFFSQKIVENGRKILDHNIGPMLIEENTTKLAYIRWRLERKNKRKTNSWNQFSKALISL
jgi:hypothetical protein